VLLLENFYQLGKQASITCQQRQWCMSMKEDPKIISRRDVESALLEVLKEPAIQEIVRQRIEVLSKTI
jgi:hypothetical protein